MKKYATGLLAVVIAVSASAFTKAGQQKDLEYYRNAEGVIVPITTEGECLSGTTEFCKYTLKANAPDDGLPEHYDNDGIPGRFWQPAP